VGFFANFAQNDYGLAMVPYAMLIIGVLLIELLRHSIIKYKKLGFSLYLMVFFPVLSMFIYVYDKGDTYLIVSSGVLMLGFLYNLLVVPTVIYFKEKNTKVDKVNFINYFELIFLCLIPIAIYLKSNHLIGGGILMGTSMLILIPYFFNIIKKLKEFLQHKSSLFLFHILVYLYISLSLLGTVFKMQHWPGSNLLTIITLSVLCITILMYIYQKLLKKEELNLFQSLQPISKIVFVTFCVTGIWLALKFADLAPGVYSDELPSAMQTLKANANDVTIEGKEYQRRYNIYKQNLDKFVYERNKEYTK
jgi:hypothetical protein